ncbi:rhomboid family intramembrane serine protease [Flavobacterium sp.]|jgi:membrane associated rhomboid family serine protease|uniref:rhomboid family intramembrane serine protease n=1 Tax=Flavobacterium sp. TaxID=239 RepID=UPI0037C18AC4
MSIIDDLKLQYRTGGIAQQLIFWNVGLFVVPEVVFAILGLFIEGINYLPYVSLDSMPTALAWKPWSIVTYAVFHSGIFHLLFNMVVLHFSTRLFTTYFNQKQLLGLYILGGIFAGIIYIVSYLVFPALENSSATLVGASGSIMAILFATVAYNPYMEIRLMFLGIIKLWHIAAVFIVLDLIQLPTSNTGGHLAHLGGALFGYLFIVLLKKGTDLTDGVSKIIGFFVNKSRSKQNKTPFKKVYRNYNPASPSSSSSRIVKKDKTQQQIDEILDKIGVSGYDSLSKEEKDFLLRAGK